jgi:hypothetical protein
MVVSGQIHAPASLPLEKNPGTSWTGDSENPEACLGALEKRQISSSCWDYSLAPANSLVGTQIEGKFKAIW